MSRSEDRLSITFAPNWADGMPAEAEGYGPVRCLADWPPHRPHLFGVGGDEQFWCDGWPNDYCETCKTGMYVVCRSCESHFVPVHVSGFCLQCRDTATKASR